MLLHIRNATVILNLAIHDIIVDTSPILCDINIEVTVFLQIMQYLVQPPRLHWPADICYR
ncbi:hypothetical protein D3C78_1957620 [compost metagenome]